MEKVGDLRINRHGNLEQCHPSEWLPVVEGSYRLDKYGAPARDEYGRKSIWSCGKWVTLATKAQDTESDIDEIKKELKEIKTLLQDLVALEMNDEA